MTPPAVVVVSFNARDALVRCVASVLAARPAETVVVDNASTDGAPELIRERFPSVRLLANASNRGYGAAANQGVRACAAELVVVLNSDTLLPAGALEAMAGYLGDHPGVGLVGPRIRNADGSLQPSTFPFPSAADALLAETGLHRLARRLPPLRERLLRTWSHDRARPVPWVLGAALALRRTAFDAVGGFDERIFLYGEEIDLARRLARAGWRTDFAPVTDVVHLDGASSGSALATYPARVRASKRFLRTHAGAPGAGRYLRVMRLVVRARWARDELLRRRARDPADRARLAQAAGTWAAMLADRELWRP